MTIRTMQRYDILFAAKLTKNEGWVSETEELFETLIDYNSDGCFIAEIDGSPIGICVAVKYAETGFIGNLIIRNKWRGVGHGRILLEHAINYLRDENIKMIQLESDLPAISLYEKIGFKKVCKSLRFHGAIEPKGHRHIIPMRVEDLVEIYRLDYTAFGADRSYFLKQRFDRFPKFCKVILHDDWITGYIMARPGIKVKSVGPWIATAEVPNPLDLLEALAVETGNTPLRIGVLENNPRAVDLLRNISSLEEQEYCWRMVLNETTTGENSSHIFSIGSASKG